MSSLVGTVIEGRDLWQTVVWAAGTGVGATLAFSFAIYGITRFADLNRDQKPVAAALAGALGVLAFVVCIAGCVIGIIVMSNK
jgi:hypothetical protein